MHPSHHGAAKLPNCLTPQSIADVFLNASPGSNDEAAPLSPFMVHVWRQHGLNSDEVLQRAQDRELFVYTFCDTFFQTRAPHRLTIPRQSVEWLNEPALDVTS